MDEKKNTPQKPRLSDLVSAVLLLVFDAVSFFWLILLFALALVCALRFGYIDARAGKLMAPYLFWLFFAAYLNLGVYLLN